MKQISFQERENFEGRHFLAWSQNIVVAYSSAICRHYWIPYE